MCRVLERAGLVGTWPPRRVQARLGDGFGPVATHGWWVNRCEASHNINRPDGPRDEPQRGGRSSESAPSARVNVEEGPKLGLKARGVECRCLLIRAAPPSTTEALQFQRLPTGTPARLIPGARLNDIIQ